MTRGHVIDDENKCVGECKYEKMVIKTQNERKQVGFRGRICLKNGSE